MYFLIFTFLYNDEKRQISLRRNTLNKKQQLNNIAYSSVPIKLSRSDNTIQQLNLMSFIQKL